MKRVCLERPGMETLGEQSKALCGGTGAVSVVLWVSEDIREDQVDALFHAQARALEELAAAIRAQTTEPEVAQ